MSADIYLWNRLFSTQKYQFRNHYSFVNTSPVFSKQLKETKCWIPDTEQIDHWLEGNDPFSHEPNFDFYAIIVSPGKNETCPENADQAVAKYYELFQ